MRLLSRPPKKHAESAPGYLLRLAATNGYPSPAWLTRRLPAQFPRAVYDPHTVERLAELLAISLDEAATALYPPATDTTHPSVDTRHNFCGHSIKRRFLRLDEARICPACIDEHGYVSAAWDLAVFHVCPIHETRLIGDCPNCGEPVAHLRPQLNKCTCGHVFSGTRDTNDQIPPSSIQLARFIYSIFHENERHGVSAFGPAEMHDLNLEDILNLVCLVGSERFGLTWETGQELMKSGTRQQLFDVFIQASLALESWPENFHARLSDRIQDDRSPTSLHRHFGPLYDTMFKHVRGTALDFVWRAYEDFVAKRWIGHHTRKHTRLGAGTAKYMPVSQAARELNISNAAVGALVESGQFEGQSALVGERRYRVVEKDSIEAYRTQASDHIGLSDAAHVLGLKKNSVMALARSGVLYCYQQPGEGPFRYWILSRASIETILSAFDVALGRPAPPYFQAVSFQTLCGIAGRYGKYLLEVITAVRDGEVGPRLRDRSCKGIQAFSFSQEEIFDWLQRDRRAELPDHLNADATALVLGTKRQVVYQWLKRGFISCAVAQRQEFVSRDAVETFQQDFVVPARVAASLGTSSTLLLKTLAEQEVYPCSGPDVDGERQYLMRRRDFQFVDISLIKSHILERRSSPRPNVGLK